MNGTTALIILLIAIIGIIAIIIVKLYYKDESKDKDISSLSDLRPSFLDKESELESRLDYNKDISSNQRAEVKHRNSAPRTQSETRRTTQRATAPRTQSETRRTTQRATRQEKPQTQTRRQSPSRNKVPAHQKLEEEMKRSEAAAVSTKIDPAIVRRQRETPKPTREAPKEAVKKPISVIKKENEVYNVNEEKILKEKEPQTIKKPETKIPKVEEKQPETPRKPVTEIPKIEKKEPVTETPKAEENKVEDLKNLFTIDELIKESKRKDENKVQETPIVAKEEVIDEIEKPTVITSIEEETPEAETVPEVETVITPIKEETPEAETVPEVETDITPIKEETPEVETVITPIKEETPVLEEVDENPIIKPLKEENTSDDFEIKEEELVQNKNVIEESKDNFTKNEEEFFDLDYRKDLDKIKKVVKGSRFLSDIKNKIAPEVQEDEKYASNDSFHRSVGDYEIVNEYPSENYDADDWEPIIPEPQPNYDYEREEHRPLSASERLDEDLRLENTRKVYNIAKQPKTTEESKKPTPKVKITSISFNLNNEEVTLNKNDEIIYKIDNDTYSSRVLAIQGDDIIVRYRGKNRTINIDAVKKIY